MDAAYSDHYGRGETRASLMNKVPFFKHDLGQREVDAVAKVLAGPILTTGETVDLFEKRFSTFLGCQNAIAVNSCTGALHLSLLAMDIGAGDEVITTPMTFIATATAIMESGALPVFVDVEPGTGNMDPNQIEAAISPRTKAIMPVHLYGQMCDMRTIRNLADAHGLKVVEDAAHCIEGERDGIRPGELGDTACFSFYATKNLTCGEGGAVITNDEDLANKLRKLRLHGMTKTAADRHKEGYQHWDMTMLGWKYNMDNIHAAILLPQMDRLDVNLKKREELAEIYEHHLNDCIGISLPKTISGVRHAHHLFPVWVNNGERDKIVIALQAAGIGVVVNYLAIHLLTYFQKHLGYKLGDFPCAEKIGNATLSLPFYPAMCQEDVVFVSSVLKQLVKANGE